MKLRRFGSSPVIGLLLIHLLVSPGQLFAQTQPEAVFPLPDLSRLEPPVRERIESLQAALVELEPGVLQANGYGSLGDLLFVYRLYEPAREAYRRAHRRAPGELRWPYLLAVLEEEEGNLAAAVEWLERCSVLDPDDDATRLRLARLELRRGRLARAAGLYRQLVADSPASATAWAGLGHTLDLAGDLEAARAALEQALELEPSASSLHYPLARLYRRLGDEEGVKRHLGLHGPVEVPFPDPRLDDLHRLTEESLYRLIVELAGARDGEGELQMEDVRFSSFALSQVAARSDAIDRLQRSIEDLKTTGTDRLAEARLRYVLGGLLVFLGRDGAGATELRSALELYPELDDARVKLANLEARSGRYLAAVDHLTRVLERTPEHEDARLKRAAAQMTLERWQAARADLERLAERRTESAEVLQRLGLCLERLGENGTAAERFAAAARIDPLPARAARSHLAAGRLLLSAGRPALAEAELLRALDLDPQLADARISVASLRLVDGRYEAAVDQFAAALAVDSERLEARLGEATALLLLGRFRQARERLEAAHAHLPGEPTIRLVLARVLAAAPDPAARDGERALELARSLDRPGSDPLATLQAAETVALARAEIGDFAGAVRDLERAIEAARAMALSTAELDRRLEGYRRQERWRAERGEDLLPAAGGGGRR